MKPPDRVQRLFALDQNFPQPIVKALDEWIPEAELRPIGAVDRLLAEIEDWEVLLALYHHVLPWDGLITTDRQMLSLPREMAVLRQTNLSLVVAHDAGNDPLRATGLLFTHLSWICRKTTPDEPQVWVLDAKNRPGREPWEFLERIAHHQSRKVDELWAEAKLSRQELAEDPLSR